MQTIERQTFRLNPLTNALAAAHPQHAGTEIGPIHDALTSVIQTLSKMLKQSAGQHAGPNGGWQLPMSRQTFGAGQGSSGSIRHALKPGAGAAQLGRTLMQAAEALGKTFSSLADNSSAADQQDADVLEKPGRVANDQAPTITAAAPNAAGPKAEAPVGKIDVAAAKTVDVPKADDGTPMPQAGDVRPKDDHRSAAQIVEDNPVLKNLGHQKDIKRDELKKQCGDWENEPDPEKRADAAYRMAAVLNYIKSSKAYDGSDRGGVTKNGKIEGITKDGDARHGTEAGMLKDFAEKGYAALPKGHRLDTTNDKHVRKNGTNMDNLEYGFRLVGSAIAGALSKAFSVLADVVKMTIGKAGPLGKLLSAGAEIVAGGLSGAFNVAKTAADGGDVKKAGEKMGYEMAQRSVEAVVGMVDPSGVVAGMAGSALRSKIDPSAPKFDLKNAALGAINPAQKLAGAAPAA